jgi:hypothetical protein
MIAGAGRAPEIFVIASRPGIVGRKTFSLLFIKKILMTNFDTVTKKM